MSSPNNKSSVKSSAKRRILVSILKPRETSISEPRSLSNSLTVSSDASEPIKCIYIKTSKFLKQETGKNIATNVRNSSIPGNLRTREASEGIPVSNGNSDHNENFDISTDTLSFLNLTDMDSILTENFLDDAFNNVFSDSTFSLPFASETSQSSVENSVNSTIPNSESSVPSLIFTNDSQSSVENISNNITFTHKDVYNINSDASGTSLKSTLEDSFKISSDNGISTDNSFNISKDSLTSAFKVPAENSSDSVIYNISVVNPENNMQFLISKSSTDTSAGSIDNSSNISKHSLTSAFIAPTVNPSQTVISNKAVVNPEDDLSLFILDSSTKSFGGTTDNSLNISKDSLASAFEVTTGNLSQSLISNKAVANSKNSLPLFTSKTSAETVDNSFNISKESLISACTFPTGNPSQSVISNKAGVNLKNNLPFFILKSSTESSVGTIDNSFNISEDSLISAYTVPTGNLSQSVFSNKAVINQKNNLPLFILKSSTETSGATVDNSFNISKDSSVSACKVPTGNPPHSVISDKVVVNPEKNLPMFILKSSTETSAGNFSDNANFNHNSGESKNSLPYSLFPNSSHTLTGNQPKNVIYNTQVKSGNNSSNLNSASTFQTLDEILQSGGILQNNVLNYSGSNTPSVILSSQPTNNSLNNIILTNNTISTDSNVPLLILTGTNPTSAANTSKNGIYSSIYQTENNSSLLNSTSISQSSTENPQSLVFSNNGNCQIYDTSSSPFAPSQTPVSSSTNVTYNNILSSGTTLPLILFTSTPQMSSGHPSSNAIYTSKYACSSESNLNLHSSTNISQSSTETSSHGVISNNLSVNNSVPFSTTTSTANSINSSLGTCVSGKVSLKNVINFTNNTGNNSHFVPCSSSGMSSNNVISNNNISEFRGSSQLSPLIDTSEISSGTFSNTIRNNPSSQISITNSSHNTATAVSNNAASNFNSLPSSSKADARRNSVKKKSDNVVLLIPVELYTKIKSNKLVTKSNDLPKIKTKSASDSVTNARMSDSDNIQTENGSEFISTEIDNPVNNVTDLNSSIPNNEVMNFLKQVITAKKASELKRNADCTSFNTKDKSVIKLGNLSQLLGVPTDNSNNPVSGESPPLSAISLNNIQPKSKKISEVYKNIREQLDRRQPNLSMSDILSPLYKYVKGKKCLICGFESKSKERYRIRRHLTTHLKIRYFKCDKCGKSFVTPTSRSLHQATHTHNYTVSCDKCDAKFTSKAKLSAHKRRHDTSKSYNCTMCSNRYRNRDSLKEHLRVHTGENPYVCSECNCSFRTRSMYTSHILHHSEEKLYACNICGKSYNSKELLAGHVNSHKGTPQYKCEVCEKAFNFKSNLAQHMLVHNDKRRHTCDICGMKFKLPHHLRSHILTHGSS